MQLLVHVGSIFEDDDQRGLATSLSTWPSMVPLTSVGGTHRLLESLGMRYGAHINAMTSADFTL